MLGQASSKSFKILCSVRGRDGNASDDSGWLGVRGGKLTMSARSARSRGHDQRSVTASSTGRLKYCWSGSVE